MYIVFDLPNSSTAAMHLIHTINQELHAWSDRYDISYNTKLVKYSKRVTFDHDETYSFFAMTWTGPDYKLVEPMRIDRI